MSVTDEEQIIIDKYDNVSIPSNVEFNDSYSIKTNLMTLFKFLNICFGIFVIFKNYIDYLRTQINAEDIVDEVIDNLLTNKLEFTLDINSEIDISKLVTINNNLYKITKTKVNEYEINRDQSGWEVNKLIVQCKLIDGTIIYPKLKTFAGVITITTTEPISNNIIVYII